MFRFTGSASFRPILLNIRTNSVIIPQTFQRYNSIDVVNSSTVNSNDVNSIEDRLNKFSMDPVMMKNPRIHSQINYFREQLGLLNQYKKIHSDLEVFETTFGKVMEIFKDEEIRNQLVKFDITRYLQYLNYSIYRNRSNRLGAKSNIDRDQYSSIQKVNDIKYRTALLEFHNLLLSGKMNNIVTLESLEYYLMSMVQYNLNNELINYWEMGVNDEKLSSLFLDSKILSYVLPVAYETKRFSYDEILRIFELNSDENKIDVQLLASMGKICINEADYEKALDILESILSIFEKLKNFKVGIALGELHLNFIGSSKDISIAKHFFDKVLENDLPYRVKLKVTHIVELLDNCVEAKIPFEQQLYFYEKTLKIYSQTHRVNSKFATLNNCFFKNFFHQFPEMTEESYNLLKKVMNDYNQITPVDELLLNTVITNYSWRDTKIFHQLIEYYNIFKINTTQVTNRIILKKMGEIEVTDEEILNQWNKNLIKLDNDRFTYIPIADWAAIRDATIFSQYSNRSELYWKIVKKYQNYFQDYRATIRFIRLWFKDRNKFNDLQNLQNFEDLGNSPKLNSLRPVIDFQRVFREADLSERKPY